MSDFTFIELNTIDSTNNYAMQLIDANKAHHGLTIITRTQTGGKGQRGRTWADKPGESLLMSIVVNPGVDIMRQFAFNAAVATAIAKVLQKLLETWNVFIKWPNDIIVNDKKAAGILIENVLRGSTWAYSVIGIGLNVRQETFPPELPNATSLKIASGHDFDVAELGKNISAAIQAAIAKIGMEDMMDGYNALLYKRGQSQWFSDADGKWEAIIVNTHADGTLELCKNDGSCASYRHGQVEWVWPMPLS